MRSRHIALTLLAPAILLSGGCYYKITDVATGKEYVTDNWHFQHSGWTGATEFQDLKTGKTVTLQSYEKQNISGDEAKREIETQKN